MHIFATERPKSITVEYAVIRADGTVEPTQVVYWHRNPLMRALHRAKKLLR